MLLKKNYRPWEDQALYHQWLFLFQKKLLGAMMHRGLRAKAHGRLQTCLQLLKQRQQISPLTLLLVAFLRISPEVHLKGSTYRTYVAPVSEHQRVSLAVRWLLKNLRTTSKGRSVDPRRLADALTEAVENRGPVVVEKQKIYQQAAQQRHQKLPYKYL